MLRSPWGEVINKEVKGRKEVEEGTMSVVE